METSEFAVELRKIEEKDNVMLWKIRISCFKSEKQSVVLVVRRCSSKIGALFSALFVMISFLFETCGFLNNPNFIRFKWRLKRKYSPAKCVIAQLKFAEWRSAFKVYTNFDSSLPR